MPSAATLADQIRSADGAVLLAGAALAVEAGIQPRPQTLDWELYGPRMRSIHAAQPGLGHLAARRLQDLGLLDAVITDSDDVLFDEAGVRDVIAVAGSVELSICPDCGYNEPLGCLLELLPRPRCAACGGSLRPDVRGPDEPPRAMARARAAVSAARLVLLAGDAARGVLRELSDATGAPTVELGPPSPGAALDAAVGELGG